MAGERLLRQSFCLSMRDVHGSPFAVVEHRGSAFGLRPTHAVDQSSGLRLSYAVAGGKFNLAYKVKHGATNAAPGVSSASESERHCQIVGLAGHNASPHWDGVGVKMFRLRQQGSGPMSVSKQYFVPHVLNKKNQYF